MLSALAVAVCYAVDRGGRPREGIVHSLILLFAAATVWVVILAPLSRIDEINLLVLIGRGAALGAGLARFAQATEQAQGSARSCPARPSRRAFIRRRAADGDRVVGLALLEQNPTAEALPDILGCIETSKSAFEQYHAVRTLKATAPTLSPSERAVAASSA